VSKHDTHFFNTFSLVIGLLVAIAILLLVFARVVAARTQVTEVYEDSLYVASVEQRIKPLGRIAVAGQDNSALAIQGPAQEMTVALAVPKDGPALYEAVCKTCHEAGLAGAPKMGDKALWAPRIKQGKATLYEHALKGFNGKAGVMPAKGGRSDLSDDLIKAGVDFLVSKGQ
jgi:cytochrome c5